MKDITLVVMAAGLGSRYGGLKQIDRFGLDGELLMEYGVYDALKAGFTKVVFIITRELERDFRELAGDRVAKHIRVEYAFQSLADVPSGFEVPAERVKPWGTTQAIAALDGIVREPFCTINADDFYGRGSYRVVADYLRGSSGAGDCCLAGYALGNTLSENGTVTRGICKVDGGGNLLELTETYKIRRLDAGSAYSEDSQLEIALDAPASMNMFGLQPEVIGLLKQEFERWVRTSALTDECLLPSVLGAFVNRGMISIKVLPTTAAWFGVTYREDKPPLLDKLEQLRQLGEYPAKLWA